MPCAVLQAPMQNFGKGVNCVPQCLAKNLRTHECNSYGVSLGGAL